MNFSSDPAYQAALDAAARSSVLAASSGLSSLALSPPPPPPPPPAQSPLPDSQRHLSTHAPPPPPARGGATAAAEPAEAPPLASYPPTDRGASSSSAPPPPPPPQAPIGRGAKAAPQPGTSAGGDGSAAGRGASGRADRQAGAERPGPGQRRGKESSPTRQQQVETRGSAAASAAATKDGQGNVADKARKATATEKGNAAAGKRGAAAANKDGQWFGVYYEHLSQEDLSRGLKSGRLFRGKIRLNPGKNTEAYVTVPGLPHDLLIRGELSRNRSVEGDEVAVEVQPPAAWFTRAKLAAAIKEQQQQQQQQQKGEKDASAAAGPSTSPPAASSFLGQAQRPRGAGSEDVPWRDAPGGPDAVKQIISDLLAARPELRATAKVVGVLTPSPKREQVVGLLRLAGRLPDPRLPSWDPAAQPKLPPGPLSAAVEAALAEDPPEGEPLPPQGCPHFQLLPVDPRLPVCRVRAAQVFNLSESLLVGLLRGEQEAGRTLVSGLIREWPSHSTVPLAALRLSLGQAGEIESETAAILAAEAIRSGEFGREVLDCLPQLPWRVGERELQGRRDFRSQRVFSIDPPTAKDLDDALSIEPLPGGDGWRVGVHIADVSHFIAPFSALDVEAGRRATSTYLVQRVVPMLPPLLCEQLCSLNPGEERLTFSVVWDMGHDGSIRSTWFGRSVIRSCAKLSYPLVQRMIEGSFRAEDTGVPLQGEGVTWEQVVGDSLALWSIAKQLREGRYRGGALRLDNTRLFFSLDKDGNPVATAPYVQKEANQLVEEFMVLANISVAKFISEVFPDRAMLRRHPPPNASKMCELQEAAEAAGVQLDVSSSASLQTTLAALRASKPSEEDGGGEEGGGGGGGEEGGGLLSAAARHRRKVELMVMLATRPMQLALYFSTGTCEGVQALWRHYALAVDHYTHFTSPIRRYPDVVVHRQLAAALDVTQGGLTPQQAAQKHRLLEPELTARVAEHCNDRRLAARDAQDASLRLYLCVLMSRQPAVTLATVNSVGGNLFFSAYLTEFGAEVELRLEDAGLPLTGEWNPGSKVLTLTRGSVPAAADAAAGGGGGGSSMGRTRHGQQQQGGRGRGQRGSSSGGGGGGDAVESLEEWVGSLPPVRNPHGLQPAQLPLHVRQFADLPLILTAVLTPGQPPRLAARIFLPEAERAMAEAERRRAEAEAQQQQQQQQEAAPAEGAEAEEGVAVRQSMVPWENMLND